MKKVFLTLSLKKNWKTVVILFILSILVVLLNTVGIYDLEVPFAHDEMEFIGTAKQIVFFENVYFLPLRGFKFFSFSAILGIISWMLPFIKMIFIYRGLHALLLISVVWNFYRLGEIKSKVFGLLLAIAITFNMSPEYGYGFVSFVPTFVVYCLVPLVFKNAIEKRYGWVFYWLTWVAMIHIWFLGPMIMALVFFEILRRNLKWGTLLLLLTMGMGMMIHPILESRFGLKLFLEPLDMKSNSSSMLFLTFASLGPIAMLIWKSKYKEWKDFFAMGIALVTPFFFLFFALGESYGLHKAHFFLILGFLILGMIGSGLFLCKLRLRRVLPILILMIAFFFNNTINKNISLSANSRPTYQGEIRALEWLEKNIDVEESLILSDYGTMMVAHYYLPVKNSMEIDRWLFGQSWSTNVKNNEFEESLRPYYQFFLADKIDEQDVRWLTEEKEKHQAKKLYIMITLRSFQNFYYNHFDENRFGGVALNLNNYKYEYNGMAKFYENPLFTKIFSGDEVVIFSVNL